MNSRNTSPTTRTTASPYCHGCVGDTPLSVIVPATTTSKKRQPTAYQYFAYRCQSHSFQGAWASRSRFAR